MSRSIKVTIQGQSFAVKTDAKPQYIKELASFVSDRMDQVKKQSRVATTQTLALLTALSIADDLFTEREQRTQLRREVRDRSARILSLLSGADL